MHDYDIIKLLQDRGQQKTILNMQVLQLKKIIKQVKKIKLDKKIIS